MGKKKPEPQRDDIAPGLVDSPVAQCMWVVEKFWDWTDSAGPPENVIARDRMLDDVMLYWLPGTGASSARLYWESSRHRRLDPVEVPTGITLFLPKLRVSGAILVALLAMTIDWLGRLVELVATPRGIA